ncbi:hypothetical protein J7T55_003020 [Diaporthe amygdali]|uniref:uncharacterized protein n=1 Tax=Phomopsis amygdali TaxID=1214568 RepID=UPI0022FE5A8D|nr:uncharacterized protein J7T55_003020 [Diaporthe amygdali]KAJ0122507.1 hypothetical protein J7T55_003020 [Diaporthe amygdali]
MENRINFQSTSLITRVRGLLNFLELATASILANFNLLTYKALIDWTNDGDTYNSQRIVVHPDRDFGTSAKHTGSVCANAL